MRRKFIKAIDIALAKLLRFSPVRGQQLFVYAFHGVLPDLDILGQNLTDPYQPITLRDIERVIVRLKESGVSFVTGREIAAQAVRYPAAWLTFDDGYANNLQLLPLLRRLDVPATIFVATGNVESGEAYWWDVLFREGMQRGKNMPDIARQREEMKSLPPQKIRQQLIDMFGAESLRPKADIDRPLTPGELCSLAKEPLIEIGNHTHNHCILTLGDGACRRREISACNAYLQKITGSLPVSIAYPNGDFDQQILKITESLGLKVGVTCLPFRNRAGSTQKPPDSLRLGRFAGLRSDKLERELSLSLAPVGLAQSLAERMSKRTPYQTETQCTPKRE